MKDFLLQKANLSEYIKDFCHITYRENTNPDATNGGAWLEKGGRVMKVNRMTALALTDQMLRNPDDQFIICTPEKHYIFKAQVVDALKPKLHGKDSGRCWIYDAYVQDKANASNEVK